MATRGDGGFRLLISLRLPKEKCHADAAKTSQFLGFSGALLLHRSCTIAAAAQAREQAVTGGIVQVQSILDTGRIMGRISGPIAFVAGLFLLLPGLMTVIAVGDTGLPDWLLRDLLITSVCGGALMVWGGVIIRHRELALNDLQPIRVRARR